MSMKSVGTIIQFQGVWKYHPQKNNEKPVGGILRDIKGSVQAGKIITIIGPSGSGKSTMLSLVNRMQTPDEGEIYFHGQDYRQYQVNELRRRVGLVHQTPTMLPGTVQDNINYGPILRKMPLSSHDMEALLDLVGLDRQFLERSATELSGGEKQRVSLLRTLANNPEVLLLDEVTAALDPGSEELVEQVILNLNREKNLTVLWVSHNLQQVQRVGGQTWFIHQGRLLESGSTEDFFARPRTSEAEEFLHNKHREED